MDPRPGGIRVMQFADKFEQDGGWLDIILANAAVILEGYQHTKDGWEIWCASQGVCCCFLTEPRCCTQPSSQLLLDAASFSAPSPAHGRNGLRTFYGTSDRSCGERSALHGNPRETGHGEPRHSRHSRKRWILHPKYAMCVSSRVMV
jgi:hypothetical protein